MLSHLPLRSLFLIYETRGDCLTHLSYQCYMLGRSRSLQNLFLIFLWGLRSGGFQIFTQESCIVKLGCIQCHDDIKSFEHLKWCNIDVSTPAHLSCARGYWSYPEWTRDTQFLKFGCALMCIIFISFSTSMGQNMAGKIDLYFRLDVCGTNWNVRETRIEAMRLVAQWHLVGLLTLAPIVLFSHAQRTLHKFHSEMCS